MRDAKNTGRKEALAAGSSTRMRDLVDSHRRVTPNYGTQVMLVAFVRFVVAGVQKLAFALRYCT